MTNVDRDFFFPTYSQPYKDIQLGSFIMIISFYSSKIKKPEGKIREKKNYSGKNEALKIRRYFM